MSSPAVVADRASLRRFRAANKGAGSKIRPAWTADDEEDDEAGSLTFQSSPQGRKLRRRNVKRQIPYEGPFPPPPPPPPPSSTGVEAGPVSTAASAGRPDATGGASGSDEDDDEETGRGEMPRPTSLVDAISSSLGDGANPTSLSFPEPSSDPDTDPDSDSEDEESTTLLPTAQPSATSGRIGPSQTASDPLPASTTASRPDPSASAEAAKVATQRHHQEVETALIVVGCVAGLICIGLGIWFIIRRRSRRNQDSSPTSKLRHFKLPFRGNRERAWESIGDEKLYGSEKDVGMTGSDLLAYLPEKPAAALQQPTPRMRVAHTDSKGYYATTSPVDDIPNNRTFGQEPPSPTESSLSSAFGTGTHIPPTPLHPPPRVLPNQRDTVYTQVSAVSSAPRFRTVNSWVIQQTRKRADEVPEQGYGLMVNDGELPRQVQRFV